MTSCYCFLSLKTLKIISIDYLCLKCLGVFTNKKGLTIVSVAFHCKDPYGLTAYTLQNFKKIKTSLFYIQNSELIS